MLTHKAIQFGKPGYVRDLLQDFHLDTPRSEEHTLHVPKVNLELGFGAFEMIVSQHYNELPGAVKNCHNLDTKKELKTHLFTKIMTS